MDLTDLDRFADGFPHDTFTTLRREAPVWWHPATEHTPDDEGFWVLSRYAEIHAAASDSDTFSSVGGGGRGDGGTLIEDLPAGFAAGVLLNMMDDPRHQRIRKLVTPSVSPRSLANMEAELRERTIAIVDEAVRRGECDFLVDVAAELPLQAIARLMGVPQSDRHRLFGWANATLDYDDHDLGEQTARQQQASAEMFEYGTWLVEQKRACPADDIISAAALAEIEGPGGERGPLTELELQMFFNLLIAAGSETTRNSIAVGLLALLEQPDQWKALRADRALLPSATEEILRWASSTSYNRRTATREVEIGGELIGTGDKVTLWWSSANRDDDAFVEPFTFDIRRDPNRHLAFGHGSHFCLGANLARVEIRLMFDVLLDRVESVEPTGPVEWVRSNKHTGLRHMPVRLHARERA
ncbi:MAG: cytochrome P450 [Actinobacteria bacterium]|nr:cytochrome P450 [Actinomycetota bacterium]